MKFCLVTRREFTDGPVSEPLMESDPVNIAYVLGGDYYSYHALRRCRDERLRELLSHYDLVMVTLDVDDYDLPLRVLRAFPGPVLSYSEGHIWDYQRVAPVKQEKYIAVLNEAAVNMVYWERYLPYYRLVSPRPAVYMPYPFLVDAVRALAQAPQTKQRTVVLPTGLAGASRNGLVDVMILKALLAEEVVEKAIICPEAAYYEEDCEAALHLLSDNLTLTKPRALRAMLRRWALRRPLLVRTAYRFRHLIRPLLYGRVAQARSTGKLPQIEFARRTGWARYLEKIAEGYLMLDMNNRETVGRNALDCAALGVPCVSTRSSDLQHKLFPETTLDDPWDVEGAVALCRRLVSDEGFYHRVRGYAWEEVQQFGPEGFKQRFGEALKQHGILQ